MKRKKHLLLPSINTHTKERSFEDDELSFGSPGSPPSSVSDSSNEDNSPTPVKNTQPMGGRAIESKEVGTVSMSLAEKCENLEVLLEATTKYAHSLEDKVKIQDSQMKAIRHEAKRKVSSVRCFWRDKIYREQTRSGKILKRSMTLTTHSY